MCWPVSVCLSLARHPQRMRRIVSCFGLCLSVYLSSGMHSACAVLYYVLACLSQPYLSTFSLNPLKPNDLYKGRTAPLTSKRCILYIYSTNTGTEYFNHGMYSQFFSSSNAVCFIILTYLVPVLFTFYIFIQQI